MLNHPGNFVPGAVLGHAFARTAPYYSYDLLLFTRVDGRLGLAAAVGRCVRCGVDRDGAALISAHTPCAVGSRNAARPPAPSTRWTTALGAILDVGGATERDLHGAGRGRYEEARATRQLALLDEPGVSLHGANPLRGAGRRERGARPALRRRCCVVALHAHDARQRPCRARRHGAAAEHRHARERGAHAARLGPAGSSRVQLHARSIQLLWHAELEQLRRQFSDVGRASLPRLSPAPENCLRSCSSSAPLSSPSWSASSD